MERTAKGNMEDNIPEGPEACWCHLGGMCFRSWRPVTLETTDSLLLGVPCCTGEAECKSIYCDMAWVCSNSVLIISLLDFFLSKTTMMRSIRFDIFTIKM